MGLGFFGKLILRDIFTPLLIKLQSVMNSKFLKNVSVIRTIPVTIWISGDSLYDERDFYKEKNCLYLLFMSIFTLAKYIIFCCKQLQLRGQEV